MKKILIPTDFTSVAHNSANYGLDFAKQVNAQKVILFNAFQSPVNVSPDPMVPSIESFDFDALKKASLESLQIFKQNLVSQNPGKSEVEVLSECCTLTTDIDTIAKENEIDLIIMGITGKGSVSEIFVGSNTIQVSRHTATPVLIVPPQSAYKPIKQILWVSDYKDVESSTPKEEISAILEATGATLVILHVDEEYKDLEEDIYAAEKAAIANMFGKFNLEFFTAHNSDFLEAVSEFATIKQVDLVVVVPKVHFFPEKVFHQSYSKSLAFHTDLPLLMIKQK
ncbi:MAG: universal stress protein [Bacteroidota bacterium]|jgi:nucleotide-binding universal stress UspA family protein